MEKRCLNGVQESMKFILGGKAIVTFKSLKTGKHFTYKVQQSKDKQIFFVSVLYDPDSNGFSYIGLIRESNNVFMHTKGSNVAKDAPSFRAFAWTWANLQADNIEGVAEVWHEGRCAKCGRMLTDPTSIERGFGPVCWEG